MAKAEEEKEEAGEVEKEERVREYQCHQCGRKYAYMHKLKHHITWLCKERAARLVEVEPRREFSSNIYELPTIDEREEEGEGAGSVASGILKPNDQGEGEGEDEEVSLKVGSQ